MMLKVVKSKALDLTRVRIPSSKSHTIRALFIASLAEGKSTILNPLISEDAISAVRICKSFGAEIDGNKDIDEVTKVKKTEDIIESVTVAGFEGKPKTPEDVLNVGNSGTTLRLGLSMAALAEGYTVFTGDTQKNEHWIL